MRSKLTVSFIGLFLLLAFLGPTIPSVRAIEYRSGKTIVIESDEVIDDDLFVVGETIVINGTVNGDLIAAGRVIVHHGTVLGSAALAAQKIRIHDRIDGSVYGAGYAMTLEEGSEVGRNVFFRGFALATRPGSTVGRDIYSNSAQMVHEGSVAGNLNTNVNSLEINGHVAGDILGNVTAKNVTSWADILPVVNELDNRSPFLRDFASFMPADLDNTYPGLIISSQARIDGDILALETADPSLGLPGRLYASIGEFLGLILIAAIFIRYIPGVVPESGAVLRGRPWASLGVGALIYVLLFPLAIVVGVVLVLVIWFIISLVSLGQFSGMTFGLLGSILLSGFFAFLFITYILTWIITGQSIGRRFLARKDRDESRTRTQVLYVALGVLLLQAAHAIPIVGFVVAFLVGAFGLGALYLLWRQRVRSPAVDEPPLKPAGGDLV